MTSIWLLNILGLSIPDEDYTGNTSWYLHLY